jgi:hypothetical protein
MGSIALFGEAQRGQFDAAYICHNLEQLSNYLGEPPHQDAKGLIFAIQMLLYNYGIVFFRVHEEGFSIQDYTRGLAFLENKELFPEILALCLPGVGNKEIFDATIDVCHIHGSLIITTEKELYDYLTS